MSFKELFDCEILIAEVEKRPGLYDFNQKEYSDKNVKEKLWTEVCEAVVTDWSNLLPREKKEKGKQIQRRWKSLRDCFRRELKSKKGKPGNDATNKRKYVYFDQLLFLATSSNDRETQNNYSAAQDDLDMKHEEGDTPGSSTKADIPESSVKREMSFKELFDCEILIAEVEKRPALYDLNLKEYSDKSIKEKLWTEVCEAVVTDWDTLSPGEIYVKRNQLQRRWKSLRECFRREFKSKKGNSGNAATNKRKYIYFDQLLFLAPIYEQETPSNYSAAQDDQDREHEKGNILSNFLNTDIPERPHKQRKVKGYPKKDYEEELINILKEKSKQECGEDKAFLLSLLPKFKKFNDEQRFVAQIEIMKVMRKVQLMPAQGQSTSYHESVSPTSSFQPYIASPCIPQQYLHQGGPDLKFSQSESNINTEVLSSTSERSVISKDMAMDELSS